MTDPRLPLTDYKWSTEFGHSNNMETMNDFLCNHLPDNFNVTFQDGTYAEIFDTETNVMYAVRAMGDGDFCNHKVTFEQL
jgi:hypothetical protein